MATTTRKTAAPAATDIAALLAALPADQAAAIQALMAANAAPAAPAARQAPAPAKTDPSAGTVAAAIANQALGSLVHRVFSTGSRGYRTSAKVVVDGVRMQVTVQAVIIGSKPAK